MWPGVQNIFAACGRVYRNIHLALLFENLTRLDRFDADRQTDRPTDRQTDFMLAQRLHRFMRTQRSCSGLTASSMCGLTASKHGLCSGLIAYSMCGVDSHLLPLHLSWIKLCSAPPQQPRSVHTNDSVDSSTSAEDSNGSRVSLPAQEWPNGGEVELLRLPSLRRLLEIVLGPVLPMLVVPERP